MRVLDINHQRITPGRPPVILVAGPVLLRPLGMAGIPTIVASSDEKDPTFASRYCCGRCILPARTDQAAVVGTLVEAGDRLRSLVRSRVPLMYGEDNFLKLVYTYRNRLEDKFLLILNDPDVALALLAKDKFGALARARDLPVPREISWEALSKTESPVFAKPSSKSNWYQSPLKGQLFADHSKGLFFENGRVAASNPNIARFREQLTFQEYVPGDDTQLWSFHGVSDEHGTVLASFVGRKLRTSPPLTGESSFIELIHDGELAALGEQIAKQVQLKGVFKMDFKTDAQTGKHYLLEVNARFNLWNCLGAENGVNIMQVAYDYLVAGRRPAASRYRTDTRWLCLRLDYRAYRQLAAYSKLSLLGWLSSITSTRTVYDVFAWRDPAPLMATLARHVQHKLRKLFKLIWARPRQWLSTGS